MAERIGVVRDEKTGELILPATQRPDGTWRKPRRVKDGYIPQEEVPVYETKGTQWAKSKPDYPIGLCPEDIEKLRLSKKKDEDSERIHETSVSKSKKNAKRKEKRKQNAENKNSQIVETINTELQVEENTSSILTTEDISKKIKSLKKKLRQIEDLEIKVKSGALKNPEREQLEKIEKKNEILDEIRHLELKLN